MKRSITVLINSLVLIIPMMAQKFIPDFPNDNMDNIFLKSPISYELDYFQGDSATIYGTLQPWDSTSNDWGDTTQLLVHNVYRYSNKTIFQEILWKSLPDGNNIPFKKNIVHYPPNWQMEPYLSGGLFNHELAPDSVLMLAWDVDQSKWTTQKQVFYWKNDTGWVVKRAVFLHGSTIADTINKFGRNYSWDVFWQSRYVFDQASNGYKPIDSTTYLTRGDSVCIKMDVYDLANGLLNHSSFRHEISYANGGGIANEREIYKWINPISWQKIADVTLSISPSIFIKGKSTNVHTSNFGTLGLVHHPQYYDSNWKITKYSIITVDTSNNTDGPITENYFHYTPDSLMDEIITLYGVWWDPPKHERWTFSLVQPTIGTKTLENAPDTQFSFCYQGSILTIKNNKGTPIKSRALLLDSKGSLMKSVQINSEETIIDMSKYPSGVYFVVLDEQGNKVSYKLSKI